MNGYKYGFGKLEKSVATAGTHLYTVAHKLHEVERNLDNTTNANELDDGYVLELLESMTEVQNEYENLRKDIDEVQQLQRDVTSTIRYQMHSMHKTFQTLKKRIELNQEKQAMKEY